MHRKTLASAITLGLCMAAGTAPALAQDQAADQTAAGTDSSATTLDTVTVTGTRITNPNVVSPTPVNAITAEQIKATGAINIGDVMTKMPQLSTTFTMGNSGRFIGTAGVQSQDLRNLGTDRTLVLVNGRRFVGGSAGSTAVDVNMIPVEWIERVDVITGGASAIYGADAVTGAVNFILKKSYEGAVANVQYGTNAEGFSQKQMSVTFGTNFAEDRGNVAFSIEHSTQNQYNWPKRFGSQQYTFINTPGSQYDKGMFPGGSWGNNINGVFQSPVDGNRYIFNQDGSVRPLRRDGLFDNVRCTDCDFLNTNEVRELEPKFGRTTVSGVASFDINDNHRLYWEGTYNKSHVKSLSQPAFSAVPYAITPDNAYLTPELAALMGDEAIYINRFDVDSGRRGEDTDRYTARMVFGAAGNFGADWGYDAYVDYGVTRERRHNLNNRNMPAFFAGLDAVRDGSGNVVCRSSIDPGAFNENLANWYDDGSGTHPDFAAGQLPAGIGNGCVPFSVFGNGAISPGAAQWFNLTGVSQSKITQFVAGGSVTNNNLFEMPGGAGAASMAAGIEYRRETSRQINDPREIEGLTFLNAIPSFSGAYNVKEAYAEFALPLLADRPFFKNLSVDAAARVSDYDSVGNTFAWKWGLNWAFDDNVRMRGTMSKAVRAPNISELYSGQSQNYFSGIQDPCDANYIGNTTDAAARAANCAAAGVPVGWESSLTQSIGGMSGSNSDLEPETGRTYTFGFVLTPQFAQGLSLNVDYWNIKLNNAISTPGAQDIVNRCADGGAGNTYCGDMRRDPNSHEIVYIQQFLQNIAMLQTSGIDFGASYGFGLGQGRMLVNMNATRVIGYTENPYQDDPDNKIHSNMTFGLPEWKGTLSANYKLADWGFDWNMRYFSKMLREQWDDASYKANPYMQTPVWAGSRVYNDVRVSYGANNQGWSVYGGVNNVFDKDPPLGVLPDTLGGGLYNYLGRSYYVGASYKF